MLEITHTLVFWPSEANWIKDGFCWRLNTMTVCAYVHISLLLSKASVSESLQLFGSMTLAPLLLLTQLLLTNALYGSKLLSVLETLVQSATEDLWCVTKQLLHSPANSPKIKLHIIEKHRKLHQVTAKSQWLPITLSHIADIS